MEDYECLRELRANCQGNGSAKLLEDAVSLKVPAGLGGAQWRESVCLLRQTFVTQANL